MNPKGEPKVLLVIAQLAVGGAETQVVQLACRLLQTEFRPEVAVFYRGGSLEPRLRAFGVPVHHVRRTSKLGVEAILHLSRILRDGQHDVVHSFLWPANWRARVAGALARTKVIISSPRSVETDLRFYHVWVDRLLATRTDAILVNAGAIREFLIARERLRPELFHVVHNGLDLERFANLPSRSEARTKLGFPQTAPLVVTVGNLQPEKNHEDFLRLAARVRAVLPEALFSIVGSGERLDTLQRQCERLGLHQVVRWEGQQKDVLPWLAASDVVVNTSRREGCCNAIMEAMATSRPVVAYAVGGNPELIADRKTGRVVPFGDLDELVEAVLFYLRDTDLASEHGLAGAHTAVTQYGLDRMVGRVTDLYRTLLSQDATPA